MKNTLACLTKGIFFLTLCAANFLYTFTFANAENLNAIFLSETKPTFRPKNEDQGFKDCNEWNKVFLEQTQQINLVGQISSGLSASLTKWLGSTKVENLSLVAFCESLSLDTSSGIRSQKVQILPKLK